MTPSISAPSSTVRVIGPTWDSSSTALAGYWGTRPNDGLSPNRPQKQQGMRIEPAPSLPWARGPSPAATAAAPPPEEPPGVRPWRHGLWLVPATRLLVSPFQPNSGVLLLPSSTPPAASRRSTTGASKSGTQSRDSSEPMVVRTPLVGTRSLIESGMPASGPALPSR